ncbi:MAG: DUF2066 domain-containing protein [Flavobacteriaceae bacterium]
MRFSTDSIPLAIIALLLGVSLAFADPYRAASVGIEIEAKNAAEARERALAEIVPLAFDRMLDRLVADEDRKRLRLPRNAALSAFSGMSIVSEQAAGTAYRGVFDVRFDPRRVRAMLARGGVRAVEVAAPPVVVIPVLRERGVPLLWDDAGAWRAALEAARAADSIAPVVLPANDYGDRAEPVGHILEGDHMTLEMFRVRYQAQGALVASFEPVAGRERGTLVLRGADMAGPLEMTLDVPEGGMEGAAQALTRLLVRRWKSHVAHGAAVTGSLGVPPAHGEDAISRLVERTTNLHLPAAAPAP